MGEKQNAQGVCPYVQYRTMQCPKLMMVGHITDVKYVVWPRKILSDTVVID